MADIVLTVTIPEAYRLRVLAAINGDDIKRIRLSVGQSGMGESTEYEFLLDLTGLTPQNRAKKILAELFKAFIRQAELKIDKKRYRDAVTGIPAPVINVPDDIVT